METFVLDAQGQEELLREAQRHARDHAFRMKRAMDAGELSAVLKHAAEVLRELRTSLLSPKNYYELYMLILDELRHLEAFVSDLHKSGTSIRGLYERVQSSGNVLPRLYLLVTVGSVYIKSMEVPAKEVLTDLVEMTKGVQHPLRGLFLRNYLAISVKDKLPDAGSAYERAGGSTEDAIAFLLLNFSETNRLWIRMQNQKAGVTKDKATREKERQDLRILVSTSLVRLSQMEGMTASVYAAHVLPRVLETIVGCKDKLAQEYLMDCVIQVFPDEFHLQNLAKLLKAIESLNESVDSGSVLATLVERLVKYRDGFPDVKQMYSCFGNDKATEKQQEVFESIATTIRHLVTDKAREKQLTTSPASMLGLFLGFNKFVLTCTEDETNKVAFVKRIGEETLSFLKAREVAFESTNVIETIKQIAQELLESLSLQQLCEVSAISELTKMLPWKTTRKQLMTEWIHTLFRRHELAKSTEDTDTLLELLAPLIKDDPNDQPMTSEPLSSSKDDFEAEQLHLSRVIHLIDSKGNLDTTFRMYSIARKHFGQGGVFRIRFTLVPLIFASLSLARELEKRKSSTTFTITSREVLQFVHEMVTALASKLEQMSVTCVNLFLQCALVADGCHFEAIAYEFITQAFIVYEDQITNSREQWKALELMVSSVRATKSLSNANYEVLATKTTQYSAKLLKKTDQATMVLNCAHLFWHPSFQDGKRVLECLQRSLRLADASGTSATTALTKVPLFLDILEVYLYFYEAEVPAVTANYLTGLSALVKEHLENMEHGSTRSECELRFRDIRRYMESKTLEF